MHYIKDAKGAVVPISLIRLADLLEFADLLEDEMVRKMMTFAKELSARCSARDAVKTPASPAPSLLKISYHYDKCQHSNV